MGRDDLGGESMESSGANGSRDEYLLKRKILVVDDNVDSIAILRVLLESRGLEVRTAQSGSEALQELAGELPDVVLLDVMMPDMSGLEVLERIRTNPAICELPVVMVTAKVADQDVMSGYQHGADYYITKPCTEKQLFYGISLVLS
jgi:pilus assembly protein CpaE